MEFLRLQAQAGQIAFLCRNLHYLIVLLLSNYQLQDGMEVTIQMQVMPLV